MLDDCHATNRGITTKTELYQEKLFGIVIACENQKLVERNVTRWLRECKLVIGQGIRLCAWFILKRKFHSFSTHLLTYTCTAIHLECVYRKNIRSQQFQRSHTQQRVTTTNDIITHTTKKKFEAIHIGRKEWKIVSNSIYTLCCLFNA